jgi:hypothetical protein
MFVQLMKTYSLKGLFQKDLHLLNECVFKLQKLTHILMPTLYTHLVCDMRISMNSS